MKKNAFILLILGSIFINNISADDIIFRDIQQKIDKKKINDVELTKVLETPSLFKNSTIRFNAKFTQTGNLSRVFHTKYDLSEYINLAVWPDEVKLWQKDGLKLFLPLVFAKKTSNNATIVGKLKKYQRIQITGLVTNDYQDQPWIEILDIKVLDKNALSEEALYHIRLGDKYHYGDNPTALNTDKAAVANIGVNLSHAEIEYKESLAFDLSDVEKSSVYELLGDVQIKQGKNGEAILSLTEALKINEESGRSNYLMALAQLNEGNFAQAKTYCEKALAVSTKNKEVILCYATILIKLEMYKLAEANCINANRLDADDIRPYALLGEIYNALNEYDVAKEMYRRAINLKDGVDNFSLHKNMAHQLLKIALVEKNAKERDNALMQSDREFNATINQINDKDAESYYLWGRVLEEWKSRPKSETDAIEKFDKAIALDPNYFKAYMHKANVLNYRMNKPKEAIAGYEKASSIKPNDLSPLKALDKIYREAKNYEKTISVNERIVAIEPKNFGALYALGIDNHTHLKQHAVASSWFMKALAVDPNHAEAELYLGITLYLSGKNSESIKHLINANAKLPNEKSGNYYLAKAYVDSNQSGKAIEALVKYNAMDQENAETHVLLAREYVNNQKTIALAISTASRSVVLAEKQKNFLAVSYDIHGWSLAMNKESQAALPLLEKANKAQSTVEIQYHLAYVYLQLSMFPETESQLKTLEASGLDKQQSADVKRLRADFTEKKNKDLEAKKKAAETTEKPETAKPEKKVEAKPAENKNKELEAADKAAKEAAKAAEREAAENAKLEEKKRIAREKEKKAEQERLSKIEEEKARENAAAKKEEEAKLKKANEIKQKEEKKKAEELAKEKEATEIRNKEQAEKDAEAKKIADKKAKEDAAKKAKEDAKAVEAKEAQAKEAKAQEAKLAKEKEASDKKAKEDAAKKAKEDAKVLEAKKAQEKEAKAQEAKLAKEKEASDKKAKEDAAKKAKEDAKAAEAKKAQEKEAKAQEAKLAKEKEASDKKAQADAAKKAKEDAKVAEAKIAKENEAKAQQAKLAKEKEVADKKAKEEAAKKAKEDEKKKAAEAEKLKAANEKAKKEEEEKKNAAALKEKEANAAKAKEAEKKAKEDQKKKEADEKTKAEAAEKAKEEERKAILKEAEEKKKAAEKARKERIKASEEAEKIEKQRKAEAEKSK